ATFLAVGLDPVVASAQLAADATQEVRLDELTVQGTAGPRLVADGYLAKQSVSATRTDTPLREVPQTVVVVPNQVFEDA
ncbi:hypothetical protein ABTD51_19600, partial [Acinetobacter baumannii]